MDREKQTEKRLWFRIPSDMVRELKIRAIDQETNRSQIVICALIDYFKANPSKGENNDAN